jgi:hypothetical protein
MKKVTIEEQYHFWEEVMIEFEGSGLRVKEFCNKKNLNFSRFKNWRYKIQQKQRNTNAQPEFIPVVINNQLSTTKPIMSEQNFELRVAKDGVHISIPCKFNAEALSNILTVVEKIKC